MIVNEKKLSKLIEKAVTKALTVEMTLEKVRDEKTGQPLEKKELVKENVFLPSFLAQIISQNEGAFRGLQEQVCKESDKINDFDSKLTAIGNVILQTENSLKSLAGLSDSIKSLDLNSNTKLIEVENGKSNYQG